MKGGHHVLRFLFITSALIFCSCKKVVPAPTATPEQAAIQPTVTATRATAAAPAEVHTARDAVLDHLRKYQSQNAPKEGLSWSEERATPPGLIGTESYRYTAGDWIITISYPITAPNMVIYQVVVSNPATAFQWVGAVDSTGNVQKPALEMADPVLAARDLALTYISTHYDIQIPLTSLTWTRTRITPESLVGTETYQYRADNWVVTISYPLAAPDQIIYRVTVSDESAEFQWQGEIGTNGEVKETSSTTGHQPVVGWYGLVIGMPTGAQFDDYLSLEPQGSGEVGLQGSNPSIEEQIKELRNLGVRAHFWGTLNCNVPDYGGCRLVVTRLRREGPGLPPSSDTVERWEGKIVSNPPTTEYDDYFVMAGKFPVRYGIDSNDPALAAQLKSLRDTGTSIRVGGQLTCGISDVNASRINVTAIEVLSGFQQPTSVAVMVEGWVGKIIPLEPGAQYDDCFERDDGQRYGVEARDAKLAARLETLRASSAQVKIWGQILYNVPDVESRQILVTEIEAVE